VVALNLTTTAGRRTLGRMEFTKAHGTANDFVVLTDLSDELQLSEPLVRALADRRRGIGADGVIRIGSGGADADAFMDYRNADGSVVEMCGNGIRVVAKLIVDHGHVAAPADGLVRIGTRSGVKPVQIVEWDAHGRVARLAVDMGPPGLAAAEVPFITDAPDTPSHRVEVDGEQVVMGVVSMGNPHAVMVVDSVDAAPVTTLGPRLERDPRFPEGVNVGFAERIGDDRIRLRVWERGVGETAACGSGACAAVVALHHLELVGRRVAVELPGGTLELEYTPGGTVRMTGPAVEVATGVLDANWIDCAERGELE
jgi:diaminopimelate epimerase